TRATASPVEQSPARKRDKSSGGTAAHSVGLPHLLPVAEVAAVLGVSTRTVRRLIERGELVTYRINRQLRVDAESVTRLLETSLIEVSRGPSSCRSDGTSSASRTSSAAAARRSSG